ncbi:MAG: thermonuclease family protein, partial [Alphaproteobacteria bacterium]
MRALFTAGIIASVACLTLFQGGAGSLYAASSLYGKAYVTDGDTLIIDDQRIRLFGIDAPELAQPCVKGDVVWPCGEEAKQHLIRLIDDQPVSCQIINIDRYQRFIAQCFNDAGFDLGASMVAGGMAVAYIRYSARYQPIQAQAM